MAAVVGSLLVVMGTDVAPAEAGCDSRVVWSGHDGVSQSIYVADASGASRLRISNVDLTGEEPLGNARPQWSPAGPSRIAWDGFDGTDSQVFVSDPDGRNRVKISDVDGGPGQSLEPQWSPDGTRITWDGDEDDPPTREIFVASGDGSGRVKISDVGAGPSPTNNTRPQWSPDGTRIVWDGLGTAEQQIYVAGDEGANRAEISSVDGGPHDNGEAQWSPDGTRVVWRSGSDETDSRLYVADGDGANRAEISDLGGGPTNNKDPQWSPDGSRIVWSGSEADLRSIYVADSSGAYRVKISDVGGDGPTDNMDPQWSPDGSRIVWSGSEGNRRSIYVADDDGADRVRVSDVGVGVDPTNNRDPQWSPCDTSPPPPPPTPAPHPPGSCPSVTVPFTDVSGSFSTVDIACAWAIGLVAGFTATTYNPGGLVTREQMAAFLARLWRVAGSFCPLGPAPFTDVIGSFAEADINCMWAVGVVSGVTSSSYDPGGRVTREQMAAFLARVWREIT